MNFMLKIPSLLAMSCSFTFKAGVVENYPLVTSPHSPHSTKDIIFTYKEFLQEADRTPS